MSGNGATNNAEGVNLLVWRDDRGGCGRAKLAFDGAPVDVLVLRLLQSWVLVKQIGNEGQVELRVAADDICRHDELPAAEPVGLVQHALGPLQVLFLLQRDRDAVWFKLSAFHKNQSFYTNRHVLKKIKIKHITTTFR